MAFDPDDEVLDEDEILGEDDDGDPERGVFVDPGVEDEDVPETEAVWELEELDQPKSRRFGSTTADLDEELEEDEALGRAGPDE